MSKCFSSKVSTRLTEEVLTMGIAQHQGSLAYGILWLYKHFDVVYLVMFSKFSKYQRFGITKIIKLL